MPEFSDTLAAFHRAEQHIEDLMALGGPVMWPLLIVSILLWTLVLERYWFMFSILPRLIAYQQASAPSAASRIIAQTETLLAIRRFLRLIKTLAGVLPMLGLLGTVTGIIETFDLIRVFGSAEPRIVARGISQALITTLAGLVMGLFGVGIGYDLNRRAMAAEAKIHQVLKP
ncbi:MotA/TolQ/ExbB proton channel family protein [Methylomonas rivi]|uniref:MotA/TolQ/ExbB proton channel family protein n=1 Tax=Methylomonas rivi TaxID=2952226 RepID=A0ABT1U448_9GAMM|nr:MotA/TolQ/ExbB proton channel family protein [Methylomonas sp. WSC-6]MCQ8128619.1 MotA/TolQ/ExbB proton channel family protein [Methylomonas sp. WSC-6]